MFTSLTTKTGGLLVERKNNEYVLHGISTGTVERLLYYNCRIILFSLVARTKT